MLSELFRMIVILKPHSTETEIQTVIDEVEKLGYTPHPIRGALQTVVAAIGDGAKALQTREPRISRN